MMKKRIHSAFGWITALFLVIAGICLIHACVGIYQMGDRPFSPEAVAVAFSRISVPVYICLGLILAGWLLQLCCPVEKKKLVTPFYPMQLARLSQRLDPDQADPALMQQIRRLRKARKIHTTLNLLILLLCSIIFLFYGLDPANFHQSEINRSMAAAMLHFFPCLAVPFAISIPVSYYCLALMKKEIDLTRQALKEAQKQPAPKKEGWLLWLRLGILAVALFFLIFGFCTGGTADVLTKAINICTECVGLG
jgi:hypothetical protein